METKSKRAGEFTGKGKRILAMAERIDREGARLHRGLSPWFYGHGWVTLADARKRLGCDAKGAEREGLNVWRVGGKKVPGDVWPRGTQLVPISELRRVMEKRAETALEELARETWEVLKPRVPELKRVGLSFKLSFWGQIFPPKLDVTAVAKRLRITPRKARAFMNVNRPVSMAARHEGRDLSVSLLELEAFEKAHRREILQARRADGTFAEPRIESRQAA